ncbi:hypothetical protein RHGRI_008145 [Rhododendron griersonianum]|uniref:ATP-dependent DNA helicase n=1 Tax=Rhododendron griersonianum TaxID=479676 RepID=A0AAV6KZS5_9ERIC|nr:hypothetical protein RHGRI_008145 [Rhododendron griersonianum]
MLTEFFYMNTHDKYAKSKKLFYKDFPSEFVWVARSKTWEKRKQGNVVGRIITANPTEGERYYLRLLLNHVRGPTSFLHLRTVDDHVYDTYEEAELAFGLLKDDKGNEKCLEEACMYQMPKSLRQLYCTLLVHCACLNPKELFCKFEDQLTEDFRRQNMSKAEARQCLLGALNSVLESMGKKLEHYRLHDFMTDRMETYRVCKEIEDEKNIDISEKDLLGVSKLNIEQLNAFNAILQAVREKKAVSFLIDGPGGTGKTFLYRTILATIRSTNKIALATATSGVAASILPNGRTAHSRFKIPLDGDGNLCCNVGKQTGLASLLNAAVLIIWDEASMAKRQSIEAVDRMLRDITEVDLLFGGKVVVLGGDFRQVLPVIPKGTRQDCIDASLVRSAIWANLKKFKLTQNMRAKTDPSFSDFLLRVGNGVEHENLKGQIAIPASMTLSPNAAQTPVQQLIDFVFPDLHNYLNQPLSMTDCAILTPKNDSVDIINEQLINNFPGKEYSYVSVDETVNKADQALYAIEVMASKRMMIKDIDENVRGWTAEVMVIEKGYPKLTKKNTLYQRLVLIDSEGTKIQATIFGSDIEILEHTLTVYHTYSIRNAQISKTPDDCYHVANNALQWKLLSRTPVEEIPVQGLSIRALKYNFVPLGELHNHQKNKNGIETKLETKGSTIFNFDPPLPEANVLRTWCLTHSAEIKNLDIDHLNQIGTPVTPAESPFERDIIKINRLPTVVSEPEYYWIHPVCKITDLNQNFFYMSCSKCNHGTDATDDTEFWCNFCHEKVEATPRCKFNVTLSDSTGDIAATAFTKVAESMFGITALYLKENTTEDGLSMAAMETITKEVEYVVRVKAYKYGPEEKSHCLFNVHQFDELQVCQTLFYKRGSSDSDDNDYDHVEGKKSNDRGGNIGKSREEIEKEVTNEITSDIYQALNLIIIVSNPVKVNIIAKGIDLGLCVAEANIIAKVLVVLSSKNSKLSFMLMAAGCRWQQKIPEFFRPYLFAPPHGIALVYSGYHVYYVKIENHELAFGWNDVIAEHNFDSKYTLLLGSMGHLMFDLFIFDEKGYQIKYPWTTTALIQQPNAPIGRDSIASQCKATNSTFFTSCLVTTFRHFGDEFRFMKKLSHGDLLALVLLS